MKHRPLRSLAAGLLCAALVLLASPTAAAEPQSECGLCYANAADGSRVVLPLESTEVVLDVQPGLMEAVVTQTFTNRTDTALEATYLYPLPAEATVTEFELRFRDRVVRSVVREKQRARVEYEAAKAEGKKAALLEQRDPSLFSTAVANFLPGETVKVVVRFIQPVALTAVGAEIRFPMTTGVKYFPADAVPGTPGNAAPTPPKVDASAVAVHHYYAYDIEVRGFPAGTITSPSHAVEVTELPGDRRRVGLAEEITIPDRDFVLRIENRPGKETQSTVVVQHTANGSHGLFTVFPPLQPPAKNADRPGRDFLFLIDHSGSMEGARMDSAKLGLQGCLAMLDPQDRFQIVVFDDTFKFYRRKWVAATPWAMTWASWIVRQVQADGGTEMQPALEASLDFCAKHDDGRDQVIVFLTDGDVGNEVQLLQLLERKIGRKRLFAFGVGAAPNAYLIGKMAELGRGQARFIADDESVARELSDLFATLATPVLTDLKLTLLDAHGAEVPATFFPQRLADVFMGRPIQAAFAAEGSMPATVLLQAQCDGKTVEVRLPVGEMTERGSGLEKHFGRMLHEELAAQKRMASGDAARCEAIEQQMLEVSLRYQLVTERTSRVAIDTEVARRPQAPIDPLRVPQYNAADQAASAVLGADETEILVLSPFEVSATENTGYASATTLAGCRLNTELRDIGSAVTVVTAEFLKDIGATDNRTLLQYTASSEVGGSFGNFGGNGDGPLLDESGKFITPNTNTRVRGLAAADNTRDFCMTDIPWDGYAVDGVDLQRGANSILFGMGSPAGIINVRMKMPMFRNANEISLRYGSYGSNRAVADFNRVLLEDQLALRLAAVRNHEQFNQAPAFSKDERLFAALRFEPAFLKKNGLRTVLKANVEAGRVRSNNPRTLPPIDRITPWFYSGTYGGRNPNSGQMVTYTNLNRGTFIPLALVDDNTPRQNHGQMRPSYNGPGIAAGAVDHLPNGISGGEHNPGYNPWVGNFANQFGGPLVFFNGDSSTPAPMQTVEPRQQFSGGLSSTGAVDRSIEGQRWQRPGSVTSYADYARNAGLPYSQFGVYKDLALTDASVFDFYNQLLDGPNKKEWQNFRTYNISLAQTFFDEQVGFELTYNNEFYRNGRLSLLSGERQAIYVDFNKVYGDGTPAGLNGEPYGDGTPNPNVGRAFLSDNGQGNNGSYRSNKESKRATVFAIHDFSKGGKFWSLRFLGKHTVTGLFSSDENTSDTRSWIRHTADDAFAEAIRTSSVFKINANEVVPNTVIYLGPSLLNATTAVGAHLPNPTNVQAVQSGNLRTFIGTWNKATNPTDSNYVDPGATWVDPYYPDFAPFNTAGGARSSTQSENPANYVGWRNLPVAWTDSESSAAAREHNTTAARLARSRVNSSAFVWQGRFLDNAIVGTLGARKDIAKSWSIDQNTNSASGRGVLNLDPSVYKLPEAHGNRVQITSHSWMVVGHLMDLPGLKPLLENSPVVVSLFYNRSSNFQPSAARVDIYGSPLAPPTGVTTDKGVLFETRDGRYSLKINRYETSSTNVSNETLANNLWFIGASQTWSGNWANRFQYNWDGDTIGSAITNPSATNNKYNYEPAQREKDMAAALGLTGDAAQAKAWELAAARETQVVAAWRAWQASVNPAFYSAWRIDLTAPKAGTGTELSASVPAGLAVPEDSVSKGYEVEFTAQFTRNWRLTFNAAKTSAVRHHVGGAAVTDFVTQYEQALNTGVGGAGDLRVWWGGAGNETALYQWNQRFGSLYRLLKLQEGTSAPELRQWRINLITNYGFDSGFLKGVNVGGGVRYESSIVIGYPVLPGPVSSQASYDIAHPYRGDRETNFDFWVGYTRRIWKDVEWQIQLNVRNAFVGNELIPITTQPDGSPAGWRIRPPQTFQLTSTFRF